MHEYARVELPSGVLWLAKDASPDGLQTITADVPDIESWVPEIPVPRVRGPVEVVDRSDADRADLHVRYRNPEGAEVDLRYVGQRPTRPSSPRNGNTMGHSRQSLAALLDLYLFRPGGAVTLSIGGVATPVRRLWGIYPMKFLLAQTQGGIAVADFRQTSAEGGSGEGFQLERPGSPEPWPTRAQEAWRWEADGRWIRRDGPVTTLRYHYVDGELDRAQVWQAGDERRPIVDVLFRPALPDVRRPFTGEVVSSFAVDVNDQLGHGVGEVRCRWEGDEVRVEVRPTAPHWFADRPMDTHIRYEADTALVRTVRVGATPAPR